MKTNEPSVIKQGTATIVSAAGVNFFMQPKCGASWIALSDGHMVGQRSLRFIKSLACTLAQQVDQLQHLRLLAANCGIDSSKMSAKEIKARYEETQRLSKSQFADQHDARLQEALRGVM